MSFLAQRMTRIDASGIRKAFAMAATMKDPINFSIGQPDYDVDDAVKEEAIRAIRNGKNSYTPTQGIDALREACSDYYKRRYGAPLENVMITSGTSGGLFIALMATLNQGDEVIFGDPYFVMYKHLTNVLGGKAVPVDTYPDFKLTADRVAKAITPRTKILIVSSPANPTGVTLSLDDLQALADLAAKHNLLLITDEIYESLTYDGAPATMVGRYKNTLVLNGLSKNAAMTGWRVGFAAGPEEIIQQMNTLQQYSFVCAPSIAQHAAIVALKQDMSAKIAAYTKKRDIIYNGLKDKFTVVKPNGAFYIFPEAPNQDGKAFCEAAIQKNMIIIPGSVFSDRNTHFRISFATSDDTLHRGVDVLNALADELR